MSVTLFSRHYFPASVNAGFLLTTHALISNSRNRVHELNMKTGDFPIFESRYFCNVFLHTFCHPAVAADLDVQGLWFTIEFSVGLSRVGTWRTPFYHYMVLGQKENKKTFLFSFCRTCSYLQLRELCIVLLATNVRGK